MTEDLIRTEMELIKVMGANFIRLAHYQQSSIVLDLCDELGLLVWEEIPWCRGGLGGELYKEQARNMLKANVLRDNVAAISCGIYNGTPVLDLDYAEDSEADTDANFVMTGDGRIIEVQGTAEKTPFSQDEFLALMALARKGVARLVDLQKMAVA